MAYTWKPPRVAEDRQPHWNFRIVEKGIVTMGKELRIELTDGEVADVYFGEEKVTAWVVVASRTEWVADCRDCGVKIWTENSDYLDRGDDADWWDQAGEVGSDCEANYHHRPENITHRTVTNPPVRVEQGA